MATDAADRPGIQERFIIAANTSDMTVDPDRSGAADLVIAGALARGWVGRALLNLEGEWAIASKPRKPTPAEIEARALVLPRRKDKVDYKRAEAEAITSHARAMREAFNALSGRAVVMAYLIEWADAYGVDRDLLSPALYHHFERSCPVCDGHGKIKAKDAPVLTDATCHFCHGHKEWPKPLGSARVLNYIEDVIGKARSGTAGNLERARELKRLVSVR